MLLRPSHASTTPITAISLCRTVWPDHMHAQLATEFLG